MESKKHGEKRKESYQLKLTDMVSTKRQTQTKPVSQQKKDKTSPIDKPQQQKKSSVSKRKDSVDSQLSAKTQPIPIILYNVQFYRNIRESVPDGAKIDRIHKQWFKNYELLQKHHGYIQWIFPNLFQSRFNDLSHPISQQQIPIFLHQQPIYTRLIFSYQMMLSFYGMHLKNKLTGQIARSRHPFYLDRYKQTLLSRFHNHMRITRILSSLTLLGFSVYAKELVKFLKEEVFGVDGGLAELRKWRVYEKEWEEFEKMGVKDVAVSGFFRRFGGEGKKDKDEDIKDTEPVLAKKSSMMKDSK